MSKQTTPTTTYRGVEITYNEHSDSWLFTLRGRDKTASSLTNAKAAIDKPAPKENNFVKFRAWLALGYDDFDLKEATVTGDAGVNFRRQDVWIKDAQGTRRKVSLDSVFADTPDNIAAMARMKEQNEIVKAARKSRYDLKEKMEKATLP